jgi:hypothetical protein
MSRRELGVEILSNIEMNIAARNLSWIIKWLYVSFLVGTEQSICFDSATKGRNTLLSMVTCT